VSTQKSYLSKEGDTVVIEAPDENGERKKIKQIPIHLLDSVVCLGNVLCSPFLLGFCAERDVSVSFLSEYGRFLASVRGPVSGNVLLRRQQFRMADDENATRSIAINEIRGKLANCRVVLNRTIRDNGDKVDIASIKNVSDILSRIIDNVSRCKTTDEVRGLEGQGAASYFSVFNHLITNQKDDFIFNERNRRPPLDEVNALLSFTYTLLTHDVRSALETVGLDPQVGFLHRDRSGRPSLALDLMEEFRPVLADRLVLSLINRKQVSKKDFTKSASGAVLMNDDTRKTLIQEYQNRKQEEIYHSFIKEKVKIGLLFFIQANLLARHIRGDIDGYPPFFWR
jgi:CRISPR-associated protein Cas1